MSDLSGRRGRVLGTDNLDQGRTEVHAEVPQVELTRYAIDLRSLSHGSATFRRTFVRYEPMPESAAARIRSK
jgi:elongation factor G